MVSLEEELPAEHRRSPAALASLSLLEYLRDRPRRKGRAGRPVVLIFDQFEEVLTTAPRAIEAKQAFFSAVGQVLDTGRDWALFIVREDHLAALAPYRDRIPTQLSNTFRLDLLGLEGAREAAVELAREGGRSFPGVDKLVHDLSKVQVQRPDGSFATEQGLHVEPVHLQVVGRRLWAAMPDHDTSIDEDDIAQYADVSTALAGYYADAVRTLAGRDVTVERAIRDWVGNRLIVDGVRSQVRREASRSAGLDNRLIQGLLRHYLVRSEQRAGATWFELSHDRMVGPVHQDNQRWEQAHLHPLQVQAKLWEQGNRAQALLLRHEAMPESVLWAMENEALMTEGEREFLAQSRTLRGHELRQRWGSRILLASTGLGAIVLAGLLMFAWGERRRAEEEAQSALDAQAEAERARDEAIVARTHAHEAMMMAGARELLARGQRAAAAMVLAEAEGPAENPEWEQIAIDTLGGPIPRVTLTHEGHVTAAAWSPEGARVVTAAARVATVWSADGASRVVLEGHTQRLHAAAWSPEGGRVA
ncbi:MAG: hypothetical protein KDK70_40735, partial [Myxococcales bacterium]|nr:hypothetical protein [Myxococcales bacterium]